MKRVGGALSASVILAVGLAAGALIAMSPDIALPLIVLLLPGLLTLVLDRSPGCAVARAVLLFQAAACVRPVTSAWQSCAGIDGCMSYLAGERGVLPAWLAAAAAWATIQVLALGLKLFDDYRLRHRRRLLAERRQGLMAEWGLEDEALH